MIEKKVFYVGVIVLLLPFGGLLIAYALWGKVIWDNPDFWYGYMAYFGTVSLAIVSWLQNIKAEKVSNKFITQQLRQKIGYFCLKEKTSDNNLGYKYQALRVGEFSKYNGTDDHSKDKTIGIWLKNVGEDIILNVNPRFGKINGEVVNMPCSISVIYKNEEILFELDNTKCFQEDTLKIEFSIEMENVAGIFYNQSFCICARKTNATLEGTYLIQEFDTHINFL